MRIIYQLVEIPIFFLFGLFEIAKIIGNWITGLFWASPIGEEVMEDLHEERTRRLEDDWGRIEEHWTEIRYQTAINRGEYEIAVAVDHPAITEADRIHHERLMEHEEFGMLNLIKSKVREYHGWDLDQIRRYIRKSTFTGGFEAFLRRPDTELVRREVGMKIVHEIEQPMPPYLSQNEMLEDSFSTVLRNIEQNNVSPHLRKYTEGDWWIVDRNGSIVDWMDRSERNPRSMEMEARWELVFANYRGRITLDGGVICG